MEKQSKSQKDFSIAIIGSRGIPAGYGGFETFAQEVARRLSSHAKVFVYNRSPYYTTRKTEFHGAHLIYVPTLRLKTLDTFIATLLSALHIILFNRVNTVIVLNVGNAPIVFLLKILGIKIIFNVDGLEWQRRKWGPIARAYLRTCARFAYHACDVLVTDSLSVQRFYANRYGHVSRLIYYGADHMRPPPQKDLNATLKKYRLTYKNYFLYVARFEPENNPELVIRAFIRAKIKMPLVMIGDNYYAPQYVAKLKKLAKGHRIRFLGYVYGERHLHLQFGTYTYIRASEVGGAHPSLIEAMASKNVIVANLRDSHKEILGNAAIYYRLSIENLAQALKRVIKKSPATELLAQKAALRAQTFFRWDDITKKYLKIGKQLSAASVLMPTRLDENKRYALD